MKKKIIPVLVAIALALLLIGGIVIAILVKHYTPTKERADLTEYFAITNPTEVAIILDGELLPTKAYLDGTSVYLDYNFVHDILNSRFYWDENENVLFYSTNTDLITAYADASNYLVTKSSVDFGQTIVKPTAESAWINIDFVKQYTLLEYNYFEAPSRIVLTSVWNDQTVVSAKKATQLRKLGGIKSPILKDVQKGDTLRVISEEDNWYQVMSDDGFIGYVKKKGLSAPAIISVTVDQNSKDDTFSHILKEGEICMAWHHIFSTAGNEGISSFLANSKGVNVVSPTWFHLKDNNGNITSYASTDYVTYCHQHNVEVWALVSNLDSSYDDLDTAYILTHSSARQNLVNQLVSAAIQYNLDGINVDFESLNKERVGDGYIQFIRELSYKCHNNGIILSVDNYVPSAYTAFYQRQEQSYFADYVVIMGYDEHTNGSPEAGSVSSLPWAREAVINTLAEVPANQVILGMPFYTRVWCVTETSEETDIEASYDVSVYKTLGISEAENFVKNHNLTKTWDETSGQFYAEYESDGSVYKVWLEDSSSMEERLSLMDEYQLAGAAFWKFGLDSASIWDTVIKYIN